MGSITHIPEEAHKSAYFVFDRSSERDSRHTYRSLPPYFDDM